MSFTVQEYALNQLPPHILSRLQSMGMMDEEVKVCYLYTQMGKYIASLFGGNTKHGCYIITGKQLYRIKWGAGSIGSTFSLAGMHIKDITRLHEYYKRFPDRHIIRCSGNQQYSKIEFRFSTRDTLYEKFLQALPQQIRNE